MEQKLSINSSLLKLEAKGSVHSVLGTQVEQSYRHKKISRIPTKWNDTKNLLKEEEQERISHYLNNSSLRNCRCSISIWDLGNSNNTGCTVCVCVCVCVCACVCPRVCGEIERTHA